MDRNRIIADGHFYFGKQSVKYLIYKAHCEFSVFSPNPNGMKLFIYDKEKSMWVCVRVRVRGGRQCLFPIL